MIGRVERNRSKSTDSHYFPFSKNKGDASGKKKNN